jgi:hypothetical protein
MTGASAAKMSSSGHTLIMKLSSSRAMLGLIGGCLRHRWSQFADTVRRGQRSGPPHAATNRHGRTREDDRTMITATRDAHAGTPAALLPARPHPAGRLAVDASCPRSYGMVWADGLIVAIPTDSMAYTSPRPAAPPCTRKSPLCRSRPPREVVRWGQSRCSRRGPTPAICTMRLVARVARIY